MTAKILPHSDLTTLHDRLIGEIPKGASVLDVGAGLAKYHELLRAHVGRPLVLLDAHLPYLKKAKELVPDSICIHGEAVEVLESSQQVQERFPPSAAGDTSVILAIDFLEHLPRTDALRCVAAMKELASQIILFVPEGNHPQEKDHYNLGGDHWQTHRSTWYAEDLEQLGFVVERWVDFHRWASDRGCDPGALWATWRRL